MWNRRNPYNIVTRMDMLKSIYGDRSDVMIYGLSDMTDENDIRPEWEDISSKMLTAISTKLPS